MDSYNQPCTREETTRTLVRYSKVTNRHDLWLQRHGYVCPELTIHACTGTEVAKGPDPLLSWYDMSRSGYVPSWTCPETALSRNGYVPKRLCPEVAMSRNGYVPKWLCPEVAMSRNGYVPKELRRCRPQSMSAACQLTPPVTSAGGRDCPHISVASA